VVRPVREITARDPGEVRRVRRVEPPDDDHRVDPAGQAVDRPLLVLDRTTARVDRLQARVPRPPDAVHELLELLSRDRGLTDRHRPVEVPGKSLDVFLGIDDRNVRAVGAARDDLGVIRVPDQDDLIALGLVPVNLAVDPLQ
jgi:hypothetical protein